MVNQMLLNEFTYKVKDKSIIEHGLSSKTVEELKKKFAVLSFDPGTSTFAMVPSGFRASAMMRLPFYDNTFGGSIMKDIMKRIGDREFFMKELSRVVGGPLAFIEPSLDSFPLDSLAEEDSMFVLSDSVDGSYIDINTTWAELLTKKNFRKMFKGPGSALNKFNQLVPEDIKLDIGVLCVKV
jgi:hypothetical protein